ncbi:hypothetical protein PMAYCL1PPCAC_14158, partial [Pristionchus mayeri]
NINSFFSADEKVHLKKCAYTCGQSAQCSENKLRCACLKGYVDVSAVDKKPAGSICTRCNNSRPIGTDYVLLFDESKSAIKGRQAMVNFVSTFLKFIDLDNSDNRFALVQFSGLAKLTAPLAPKANMQDIMDILKQPKTQGIATNTVEALQAANDEVYALLPTNSTRPRVTILLTDGAPTSF